MNYLHSPLHLLYLRVSQRVSHIKSWNIAIWGCWSRDNCGQLWEAKLVCQETGCSQICKQLLGGELTEGKMCTWKQMKSFKWSNVSVDSWVMRLADTACWSTAVRKGKRQVSWPQAVPAQQVIARTEKSPQALRHNWVMAWDMQSCSVSKMKCQHLSLSLSLPKTTTTTLPTCLN